MAISVGGIDLAGGVVDAQYRIAVLEKIVQYLVNRMPGTIGPADIKRFQDEAFEELRRKYPDAGLTRS
jgi:hypothetical protein